MLESCLSRVAFEARIVFDAEALDSAEKGKGNMAKRTKKGSAVSLTESLDVGQGKEAFDEVTTLIEAIPRDQIVAPRIDLQRAAIFTHSVARRDEEEGRRARFDKLAQTGFYEAKTLPQLRQLALASWYIRSEQRKTDGQASSATVPDTIVKPAYEVRGRMLTLLDYYFSDKPSVQREIARIREGSGYQDLANDLLDAAQLVEDPEVFAVVRDDRKNYQRDDVKRARDLAGQIFELLGLTGASASAKITETAHRVHTALDRAYAHHALAGRFAFDEVEDVDVTYPNLVSACRDAAVRATKPEPVPTPPTDPSPAPSAGAGGTPATGGGTSPAATPIMSSAQTKS